MAQPKTILIVDDDADLREALAEQLELNEEFKATEAGTAAEGLRLGREMKSDLILLDVDLPDMDGREACRQLREAGVRTPVIMLTGASASPTRSRAWTRAPTTTSPSPSMWRCCSPASAPSCAATSSRRTRSSASGPTSSARPPRC